MPHLRRNLLSFLYLMLTCGVGYGQENTDSIADTLLFHLPDVVVTAIESKAPGSTSLLPASAIKHVQPITAADLMQLLPIQLDNRRRPAASSQPLVHRTNRRREAIHKRRILRQSETPGASPHPGKRMETRQAAAPEPVAPHRPLRLEKQRLSIPREQQPKAGNHRHYHQRRMARHRTAQQLL